MKHLKHPHSVWFTGLLMVLFASCSFSPDSSEATHYPSSPKYDSLLQSSLEHGFPGIVIGVHTPGQDDWIGVAGYADLEQKKPMQGTDRFHLASVTKIFTSVAVLKLIDEGKLTFKSKAIDHLDASLVSPIPFMDEIEVGQLLDHSSGIYSFNNDMEYLETLIGKRAFEQISWSTADLLSLAYGDRVEPQAAPGTGHYYGDTNLILLGLIIENITGKPFRKYIKENLLQPLDLRNTGFYSELVDPAEVALTATVQGYLQRSEDLDAFIEIHPDFKEAAPGLINTTPAGEKIDAGAGMVSTAADLLTFGKALYTGNIISSESLAWLLSIGEGIENEEIGSTRQGIVSVRHKPYGVLYTSLGDGAGGMNTMLAFHPQSETIIVVFTNIFGKFNEHDFFMDEITAKIIN